MSSPILVTGATGTQGRAVVRHLLAGGRRVRALTRNIEGQAARELAHLGVELAPGDLESIDALAASMRGIEGVFSVQVPGEGEIRQGRNLVTAAKAAGARTFVHSSVARAGDHEKFTTQPDIYIDLLYWRAKREVERIVEAAGFEAALILRPAFMMDNFVLPKAAYMFPGLAAGRIATAIEPATRLDLIAADDIGAIAAAAFVDPAGFAGQHVDLAAQSLTIQEIGTALAQCWLRTVRVETVSPSEAIARGLAPGWVAMQQWLNAQGYCVDISAASGWGVRLTGFGEWLQAQRTLAQSQTRSSLSLNFTTLPVEFMGNSSTNVTPRGTL